MKLPLSVWVRRPWKTGLHFWILLIGGAFMISTYALTVSFLMQLGWRIAVILPGAALCAIFTGILPLCLTPCPGKLSRKIGIRKIGIASLWRPAFCGFLWIFLFSNLITPLWEKILLAQHCHFEKEQPLLMLITQADWSSKVLFFLTITIAVPIMEELFFRRYLNGILRKAGGAVSLFAGAAIFAAAHNFLLGIPALFFMGIVFQLLYSKTRNFAVPVLCHALVNAGAFIAAIYLH